MLTQLAFIIFAFSAAVLFYVCPQVDISFSELFFRQGEGFFLSNATIIRGIYRSPPLIILLFTIWAIIHSITKLSRTRSLHPKHYLSPIYVMTTCLLGPGLIVHSIFKNSFGRARPIEILEFGGSSYFSPAFVISNQCFQNCAFVSGHAAVGFMLFSIAYLYQGATRLYWQATAVLAGSILGFARIVQGAHFLSDVLFSGIFVFLTAYFLGHLLKPYESTSVLIK